MMSNVIFTRALISQTNERSLVRESLELNTHTHSIGKQKAVQWPQVKIKPETRKALKRAESERPEPTEQLLHEIESRPPQVVHLAAGWGHRCWIDYAIASDTLTKVEMDVGHVAVAGEGVEWSEALASEESSWEYPLINHVLCFYCTSYPNPVQSFKTIARFLGKTLWYYRYYRKWVKSPDVCHIYHPLQWISALRAGFIISYSKVPQITITEGKIIVTNSIFWILTSF